MATSWRDLIALSGHLVDQEGEAAHRGAIGRAYYACLHLAREITRTQASGHDSHSVAWRELELLGQRRHRGWDFQAAARRGRALKARREEADYQLGMDLTQASARDAVESARKLLASLQSLPA